MSTQQLTPEQRKKRIETVVKVLGMGLVGLIAAPFVLFSIGGLLGLVVIGVISLGIINFTPVVAAMMANWRLKALKAEAMRNPVETLQNDYIKKQNALADFRKAIVTFSSEVKNFADKLVGFNKQYPEEAPKFKEQLSKMKQLLELRQNKYQQAQDNLAAYQLEIQKAGAVWEMGCAAARMNESAGMTEGDWIAKIQVETALDSVQKNLNEAFADLEISLLDDDKEKAKKMFADKQQAQLVNRTVTVDAEVIPAVINNRQKIAVS